jgi:uncharacterized protein (DUF849 family)
MSKKTEATQASENSQPAYVADLLMNGTTILEAPTLETLAEMVNDIPADTKYSVGAVGRKQDDSAYTLRVDLIKN